MDNSNSLSDQVHKSSAYRVFLHLQTLKANYSVFHRNRYELKNLILTTNKPEMIIKLWNEDNQSALLAVIDEVVRLLHNFLASAKTLIDHTRNLISNEYSEKEFFKEYQREVKARFEDNQLTGFVEGLRNYTLHFHLPVTHARFSMSIDQATGNQNVASTFVLKKKPLSAWSEWPPKAKNYLKVADEEIDIEKLADAYYQQVAEFHRWLSERLREIHRDELNWLEEMSHRIERIERDGI